MKQIKFEHRYQHRLEVRILEAQQVLQLDRSAFAERAVMLARRLWRKGKWHPRRRSPFLTRSDTRDKCTVWLRFDRGIYLYLKKMARALDISLAEMLRLAMDVLCSYVLLDGPGIVPQVVSRRVRPALRIRGVNVLDHIDHDVDWVGGVLDFNISDVRDVIGPVSLPLYR